MTLSANPPNSLPWVLPVTYITDWHTILLILSLLVSLILFLPSTKVLLFVKFLSLVINNSPMNRFPMLNSLHKSKILVLSTIPLLCRIWPGFKQKSSLFFANKVLVWYKHMSTNFPFSLDFPWWQDQNYSSANYMHCSAKLSVTVLNSLQFTSTTFSACPLELSGWASDFFVEGRHLSKILIGRQCNLGRYSMFGRIIFGVKIKVHNVFYTHTSIYSN